MRDIKFRAWDHVNNVMLHADFGELQDIGGEWTAWDLPIDSPTNTGMPFEVMQFTGLTDKNGVEIYEGDIAERDGWIGEVYYKVVNGRYEMAEVNNGAHLIRAHKFNQMIVIGSVHETPELLNK